MNLIEIIGIAVGLSMDAFAVAIAASVSLPTVTPRQVFRFSFHFGFFQAMMPVIGWLAGIGLIKWIAPYDHWLAFLILVFIGGKAIHGAFHKDEDQSDKDPTKGISLVILSIATSIDALAVGLSLAALNVVIWTPAILIGIITGSLTWLGMRIGSRLGGKFGTRMEIIGGLVLIGIGVKIMIEHLFSSTPQV